MPDKARLTTELPAGRAAVGLLADFDTAPAISDRLTELGGTPKAHELTDEAVQAAAADTSAACRQGGVGRGRMKARR